MKNFFNILGPFILLGGALFGLVGFKVIDTNMAVGCFVVVIVLLFAMEASKNSIKSGIDTKFEKIMPLLNKVSSATMVIQKFLQTKFENFIPLHEIEPDLFVQEKSPLSVTDLGESLLAKSGAKKILDKHYSVLEKIIDKKKPKAALDVQERSVFVIAKIQDKDYMKSVKDFVYQNPCFGDVRAKIKYLDVLRTMVIDLRDRYLEKHPELKPLKKSLE